MSSTATPAKPILTQVKEFFEFKASDFMREWKELSDKDRADIKGAFENGTMTY
jgi:hypothetical protein